MKLPLKFSREVAQARARGGPVVALESTIITHGMPWPDNARTAAQVEDDIRAAGAVPATIAVIDGQICIGLTAAQLDHLAQANHVAKLSRADLAICLAQGGIGATTVAATMVCARAAGIEVFATGGIGGVHRGWEHSLDISADLQELAQTAVTVVAAGPKAILDIPATLEVLETLGVPVIAYGQSALPAFWSRDAGMAAPLRLDTPRDIANAHRLRRALDLPGGQLVANPIPPADEIPLAEMTPLIDAALAEAQARAISAKEVTPFLLAHIHDQTAGRALAANIALVRNNARLAAAIAREMITA